MGLLCRMMGFLCRMMGFLCRMMGLLCRDTSNGEGLQTESGGLENQHRGAINGVIFSLMIHIFYKIIQQMVSGAFWVSFGPKTRLNS
jgi:hypothetical protein